MNRKLLEDVLYALEYSSDITKPEGLSGCDCPICAIIPVVKAELAKPEPFAPDWADYRQGKDDALAEFSQEPVAWMLEWSFNGEERGYRLYDDERHCLMDAENDGGVCRPLYTKGTTNA